MTEDEPATFVASGWTRADAIAGLGGSYRLLHYIDGTVRFEHRCDRGARGVIICAPALRTGPSPSGTHTLTYDDLGRPTVRPSVLCPDCGTHGFITDGRWAA